jgi:hypothetical protein
MRPTFPASTAPETLENCALRAAYEHPAYAWALRMGTPSAPHTAPADMRETVAPLTRPTVAR